MNWKDEETWFDSRYRGEEVSFPGSKAAGSWSWWGPCKYYVGFSLMVINDDKV